MINVKIYKIYKSCFTHICARYNRFSNINVNCAKDYNTQRDEEMNYTMDMDEIADLPKNLTSLIGQEQK